MGILKTLTINGTTYNVTAAVPAANVTLLASAWKSDGEAYSQVVDIPGVTAHTKVDLQPTSEQLVEFHSKDLAFVAENDGGTVTVFAIGDKPASDHTIQITKTEVEGSGKIRGNTVGTTIKPERNLVKATNLTEEEKAQVRDNIGALGGYYSTEREEIGVSHENINAAYIWGLYDALIAEYPDNVQKNPITNNDGTFTNYEYVISTGEYSTDGFYQHLGEADEHIKKPKYLVESGIHGSERKTVFSTYRFVRDVLKGHNVPHAFREGVILHILPVANPTGFDAFNYEKTNGVDINNNFDCNWTESDSHGAFPASEPETQAITKWLTDNRDAKLFIDFHNSGKVNENVAIIGTPDNEDAERVKRTALRGVDRVISYWRDVIGYPPVNAPYWNEDGTALEKDANGDLALKETPVLFSYSASMIAEGHAFGYAQNVLGIPAFVMETSSYYGDYDEWKANEQTYPPESIAMGAEALGNILIELFSETSEVVDMTEVNEKLDTILQGVSFREVKGQLVVNATTGADIIHSNGTVDDTTGDLIPAEGKSSLRIKLPIPNGARIVCIKADAETETAIKETQTKYFVQATIDFSPIGYLIQENLFHQISWGYNDSTSKWNYIMSNSQCYNTDGFNVGVHRLKAGTYNWAAYYWND